MITVHHLENSRSQRVLWLLEELGLPYELRRYARDPKTMLAPPALRAVHPLGKSPVIEDEGRVLAESGAILEYLAERHGGGRLLPPAGSEAALRCRYWLHYAEGSLMPLLVMKLINSRIVPGSPTLIRPIARKIAEALQNAYQEPNIKLQLAYVDQELGKHPWFAGEDLSIADMQMSFPLEAALARAAKPGQYPNIASFVARIQARAAYQRAAAKAGPAQPLR
ncbi:glutathione S-transferase [Solimonas aquatica]|uniref:glutathione transferase n=1 Tax=Solimonas aquatica TaxID=489703 RepID=A0A1H9H8R2_9GAMM|nr:glutathione S-transferase [Solimonas aquatica]SEQ58710.1 glutathione S-transferase [Solimonas aquatica]